MESVPPKAELTAAVKDLKLPIAQRMRAVFYLRTLGGDDAVDALCEALKNKEGTCLYRHEVAYVLGQMQQPSALPTLSAVLEDSEDDSIVRHECAEAIGAIGDIKGLEVLQRHVSDAAKEVSETCEIAIDRLQKCAKVSGRDEGNPFESVDPAPALPASEKKLADASEGKDTGYSVEEMKQRLLDTSLPLYERYRAMFGLRNLNTEASTLALTAGLADDSALFRHEVAYVLGQLAHPAATDALEESLTKAEEHPMVRHEAAEALGAIGTPKCVDLLKKYMNDDSVIVRESCEVALDVVDYWGDDKKQQE